MAAGSLRIAMVVAHVRLLLLLLGKFSVFLLGPGSVERAATPGLTSSFLLSNVKESGIERNENVHLDDM